MKLAGEALATRSKDLQLAAWLTEAQLGREGFAGLREGLELTRALIERFWDHLHPQADDLAVGLSTRAACRVPGRSHVLSAGRGERGDGLGV